MRSQYPERAPWNARHLRAGPAENNQATGVRRAKDHVLGDEVKVAAAAG
jgi:hypothetical protein